MNHTPVWILAKPRAYDDKYDHARWHRQSQKVSGSRRWASTGTAPEQVEPFLNDVSKLMIVEVS
jgi:hypothetical protein